MKKIIYVIFISVILLTITSIVLSNYKGVKATSILSLNTMNSFYYNEKTKVCEVPYYIDSDVNNFSSKEQITESYLTDKENMKIRIEIDAIKSLGIQTYNKKKYFGYIALFDLPMIEIKTDNCYLLLCGVNGDVFIKMGPLVSTYKEKLNEETVLSVDQLYGLIDDNVETVCGIIIDLFNNSNETLYIEDFYISSKIKIAKSKLKELEIDSVYSSQDNIKDILGYSFDLYQKENDIEISIPIGPYQHKLLLLPLSYESNIYMYQCPISIKFKQTNDGCYDMDNFMYYDNSFQLDNLQKVVLKND